MHGSTLLIATIAGLAAADVHHPHQVRAVTNTALQTSFPKSSGTTNLAAAKTIAAKASYDGEMKQWDRTSAYKSTVMITELIIMLIENSQHLQRTGRDG